MSTQRVEEWYSAPLLLITACLLTGGALWGCDSTVDLADEPSRAFTLWGAINPRTDTQTVKVFPMGTRLEGTTREGLAATVITKNLETGRIRTWNDSLVQEENGKWVHVFWSAFSPEYGHSFRIEASHDRQGTATATAAVPPWVELEVLSIDAYEGVQIRIPPEAPQVLPRATLHYTVKFGKERPFADDPVTDEDVITTVRMGVPVERGGNGWLVETQLDKDARAIDERLAFARDTLGLPPSERPGCCKLDLLDFYVEVQIVDRAWTFPGDTLDRRTVVRPGALSNVKNGFGLVGAGYRQWIDVPVPEEVGEEAGFSATLCTEGCGPSIPAPPRTP